MVTEQAERRLPIISDSDYGRWRDILELPTTAEQDEACLLLEDRGYRFLVDYGYENAISKCEELIPNYGQIGHS